MIKKYSVKFSGHSTSFSLEPEFWEELQNIAARKKTTLPKLVGQIDDNRDEKTNLSSALRVWLLNELKRK